MTPQAPSLPCGAGNFSRRDFVRSSAVAGAALATGAAPWSRAGVPSAALSSLSAEDVRLSPGAQRLPLPKLKEWESWSYGMFIHFGLSTFAEKNHPPPFAANYTQEIYRPTKLDVGQWVAVARDAGMKYIHLTAKHHAGHCLWPSKHTDFTVANSPDTTDVVGEFVRHCREKGLKVGIYYAVMENHHLFGSLSAGGLLPNGKRVPWYGGGRIPKQGEVLPYVSSLYQNFMTAQIDELIGDYGPVDLLFIDIPSMLGIGYRHWLYERIARRSPATFIEMNNGMGFDGKTYQPEDYFPQDVISYERAIRSATTTKWWNVEGRPCYIPGEVLELIGNRWFWVEEDKLRPARAIAEAYRQTRARGLNYNLNVPPDRSGQLPSDSVTTLMEIQKLI
ncbi:MAG: twin-arginine translocation signal domain-containing protein [Planctomycetes bacterium]|nr:twin-arginine translocation signal domain-containing protein [Planctomycetota bacterium]